MSKSVRRKRSASYNTFLHVTQNSLPPSSFYFALHLTITTRNGNELPNLPDFVVVLDSSDSSDLTWHIDYNRIKRRMRLRGKNVSFTDVM